MSITIDDESIPPDKLDPTETSERSLFFTDCLNNSKYLFFASLNEILVFVFIESKFQYSETSILPSILIDNNFAESNLLML